MFRNKWLNREYTIPTDTPWVRILVCLRFLLSDKPLDKILEAMTYGFTDMQLVELAVPFFLAKSEENYFYIDIKNTTFLIRYDVILKIIEKKECRRIPNEKKISIADLKR